jgi:polyisoprenoid-binding protein YceI
MADDFAARTVDGQTVPAPGTYTLDPAHTMVEFVVRHLGLAKVRGRFSDVSGDVVIDEDITRSSVEVIIGAASIDTRDKDRDAHLRSPDFLDVEQSPQMTFRSTAVSGEGDEWTVTGDLTIRDVTRPVTLVVDFDGGAKDPWGGTRIGFSAHTEINREDFGLTWNQPLETGGWLVGKQVKIEISAEAVLAS